MDPWVHCGVPTRVMAYEAAELFVVDLIDDEVAVLVGPADNRLEVSVAQLPGGTEEGALIRVALAEGGAPDWSTARIDADEMERRQSSVEQQIARFREETGEDIEL